MPTCALLLIYRYSAGGQPVCQGIWKNLPVADARAKLRAYKQHLGREYAGSVLKRPT